MAKATHSELAEQYPNVHRWILEGGWIEIGDDGSRSIARALDEGGMVHESKRNYKCLEEVLEHLDAGIAAWTGEEGA